MFVTHARTAEELKAEIISDIARRISNLDNYIKIFARSEREKAKVNRAIMEFQDMLRFWQEIELASSGRGKKNRTEDDIPP